jgi:hypothetical protein
MRASFKYTAVAVAFVLPALSQAQETARVISSTPVTQQLAVPHQVCSASQDPAAASNCATQTINQATVVGYRVVYEFAGKQYTVQMPQDPGKTLTVQVSPVPEPAPASVQPAVSYVQAPQPAVVVSQPTYVTTYPAPYYYPYYAPYYAPFGVSIGLGYRYGGWHGGGWHGGHRR